MAVGAVSRLMIHWVAIAWQGQEAPEWCASAVGKAQKLVCAGPGTTHLFFDWAQARMDMHIFLSAWSTERAQGGRADHRRKGRAGDTDQNCEAAITLAHQLWLLRALKVCFPQTVDDLDIAAMKEMDNSIGAYTKEPGQVILLALEDQQFLEAGLAKIPECVGHKNIGPRRRL